MSTPSLVTRLTQRAKRSSLPGWGIYGGLLLSGVLISLIARSQAGVIRLQQLRPADVYDALSGPANIVAILAFYYLFDDWIAEAADDSRSISNLEARLFTRFKAELRTIPLWPHLAIGVAASAVSVQAAIAEYGFTGLDVWTALVLVDWATVSALTFGFVYRIVRIIVISVKFYSGPIRINLFNLPPLFALSSVVSRAGLFLLLMWYLNLPFNLSEFVLSSPAALGSAVAVALIPFGAFLGPQAVLSRRLNRSKADHLVEVSAQLERTFRRLKHIVEEGNLADVESVRSTIDALIAEGKYIDGIPTWPWRLGTFRIAVTAVLLPIVVWLIQQLLNSLLPF
jgi:hypothetical protein